MSFRKEKKYRFSRFEIAKVKQELFAEGMQRIYNQRSVHSCYFDNSSLVSFRESEEGVLPRKKIRVRWYDQQDSYMKEVKISSIEGRFKSSNFLQGVSNRSDIFKLDFYDNVYGRLRPKIVVSYQREYFKVGPLRVTIDSGITYRSVGYRLGIICADPESVMEVKASIDCGEDAIENTIRYPTSRFSKYSRGIIASGFVGYFGG